MKQYRVIRNCWGFMLRPWKEGQVVDLPDDANPPHHFELIGTVPDPISEPDKVVVPQVKANPRNDVMAPQTFKIGQPIKTTGGFASKYESTAPKELVTAAQAYNKRGRPKK